MRAAFAFVTLVAILVFLMGLVQNSSGTAQVINSAASGLVALFSLELGNRPVTKKTAKK
jgi:hypothetical protein